MNKKQLTLVLFTTLLSVIFLSTAWEFWFEDFIGGVFHSERESESLSVRFEYVISISIFVALSLIIPALAGFKLIDNDDRMQAKIKRLSEEDYLTKLYNRRKTHETIESEIVRSKRYNSPFSLILLDIDDFKNINDSYGHNIGDGVLVRFSSIIRQTIRETDIAGRWGGEEFLVICPETTVDGASSLAEKLRSSIENSVFKGTAKITTSIGVTGTHHGDSVNRIINRADKALYSAKQAGKNRVTVNR